MGLTRWFIVVIYLIPLVGTVVAIGRRAQATWSFGRGIRARIPDNPLSRTLKAWSQVIRAWWSRQKLGQRLSVRRVNLELGRIEYRFGHLRDYSVGTLMTAGTVFYLTMCLLVGPEKLSAYFYNAFYCGFFACLSLATYRRHVDTGLKMTEFMRTNPRVHPQEFFDHYCRRLGPLTKPIPERAEQSVDPEAISYRTGQAAGLGYARLLYGFYDTAIFARSAYKALEVIGPAYGREVFDVMASLWGSRIIQLFRSELKVIGAEKFKELHGKIILVFNHKSHLDFVINFFALSKTHLKNGRRLRPRYMAAKDHFVDNKFIYQGLGVGKLIEAVDMVFVDRTGKGTDAITQAAEVLSQKDVEIAMYPQGTRAYGNLGPNRERRDAGFYTTGSGARLKEELGHLKKGVAYLALDTALALHRQGRSEPVHLVCVGIEGTADLVPKGSFKVRTESEVIFTVGEVLTLRPDEVAGMAKPQAEGILGPAEERYQGRIATLMQEVHRAMIKTLDLHRKLMDRLMADVKAEALLARDQWMTVKKNLNEADRQGDLLPFKIIDRIYALDPSYWKLRLERLAQLLADERLDREALNQLGEEVIDFLFATRGKLMKTAALSEQVRAGQLRKAG